MTAVPDGSGGRPAREPQTTRAMSGRAADELTLEAAVRGGLCPADLRIHPETLRRQADVAEEHGNAQLGGNLRLSLIHI